MYKSSVEIVLTVLRTKAWGKQLDTFRNWTLIENMHSFFIDSWKLEERITSQGNENDFHKIFWE